MFGTVGALELDEIGFNQAILQAVLGGAVTLIGYLGLKWNGCFNL